MSEDVVQGVKSLIEHRAKDGLDLLSISWFGGEPLLAPTVVLDIITRVRELKEKYNFAVKGGFTTNGYLLTKQLATELIRLDQWFFQISLDGWETTHDQTRVLVNGNGTFDTIFKNLVAMKDIKQDFNVQLRLHQTTQNEESMEKLGRELYKVFNGDDRFTYDIQDVRDLGGDKGKNIEKLPKNYFEIRRDKLIAILFPENLRNSVDKHHEEIKGNPVSYICYASKPNHFLIRSTGRIGKCTVALEDERNDIGELHIDGSMTFDNDLLMQWSKGFNTFDQKNLACPAWKVEMPKTSKRIIPIGVATT
jgi:uncharacterized protein